MSEFLVVGLVHDSGRWSVVRADARGRYAEALELAEEMVGDALCLGVGIWELGESGEAEACYWTGPLCDGGASPAGWRLLGLGCRPGHHAQIMDSVMESADRLGLTRYEVSDGAPPRE